MTVPVPESIRATAIEAGKEALTNYHSGTYSLKLSTLIVDAVLPAVVAQVQADAKAAAQEMIDDLARRLQSAESSRDMLRLQMAEYREKGENNG